MKKKKDKQHPEHWGQRLKSLLKEKSITLREVSRICNTSPSVVSGWINNGNSPSDLLAIKTLSDRLGVSFTWLLTGYYEKEDIQPTITEFFDEVPYFDGYARIRIDRLTPKKRSKT